MSTIKERNWVSIQSLSRRGYILCWFNGKKRPGASALHFCFFYCAHWTLSFCTKFCRNVSKVMLFRLHLNKWICRMSGPDARSLKLALIFTIFLYYVLTEAWRTKFTIRWGWEELTKHYQCLKVGSKKSASPPWRKSHVLVACAQSSVKSQQKWPKLTSSTHLAITWTGNITKCLTNDIKETNLWAKFQNGCQLSNFCAHSSINYWIPFQKSDMHPLKHVP